MLFMKNDIFKYFNSSSVLELLIVSISTTIPEGPEAFPDFVAFSTVDTMLCVISGSDSAVLAFSNIAASHENSMLSKHL